MRGGGGSTCWKLIKGRKALALNEIRDRLRQLTDTRQTQAGAFSSAGVATGTRQWAVLASGVLLGVYSRVPGNGAPNRRPVCGRGAWGRGREPFPSIFPGPATFQFLLEADHCRGLQRDCHWASSAPAVLHSCTAVNVASSVTRPTWHGGALTLACRPGGAGTGLRRRLQMEQAHAETHTPRLLPT